MHLAFHTKYVAWYAYVFFLKQKKNNVTVHIYKSKLYLLKMQKLNFLHQKHTNNTAGIVT